MSDVERYYNEFYGELARLDAAGNDFSKISGLVAEELANGRRLRVADLGCGYGSVSAGLAARGHTVYGLELGDAALRALPERGVRPIKGDLAATLPLGDGSVDVVLLLDVLEHVFNPLRLLTEAHRVLRPAGVMIVTVPLYFDVVDRIRVLFSGSILSYDNLVYGSSVAGRFRSYNYDHIRFFRPADVLELLRLAGLTVERRIFGPIPSGPVTALRPPLRLLARWLPRLFAHSLELRARKS